jgi:hypothetical protein
MLTIIGRQIEKYLFNNATERRRVAGAHVLVQQSLRGRREDRSHT